MQGIGSILDFLLRFIPLSEVLSLDLVTNFSILCLLKSVLLLMTALISVSVIKEDLDAVAPYLHTEMNAVRGRSRGFIEGVATMPREVWQIFAIQFFTWLGWFSFCTYYMRYALQITTTAILEQSLRHKNLR